MPIVQQLQDPQTFYALFLSALGPLWDYPEWMWSIPPAFAMLMLVAAPRIRQLNRPDWPLLSPMIRDGIGLPSLWFGRILWWSILVGLVGLAALAFVGDFLEVAIRLLQSRLTTGCVGAIVGGCVGIVLRYWSIPAFERAAPAADLLGEAPIRSRNFDPVAYFRIKQGVFFGMDAAARPVYLPLTQARQHLQVIGRTGSGKGVALQVLLPQYVQHGESAIVFDPKDDKYLPEVLCSWCSKAGVPFRMIDLRAAAPQINLLAGISARDLGTLFAAGFGLADSGGLDRVYRLDDRKAAQTTAELISGMTEPSMPDLLMAALAVESVTRAKVFSGFLQELAALPVFATRESDGLSRGLTEQGITYVVGSTLDPVVIMAQKMLLLRTLQLIYARPRSDDQRWITLAVDEFKYLLSQSSIDALGVVRDFNCHVIVAHQSLGDLEACPGIPAVMVAGAVRDNTGLKLTYRPVDDVTARWAQDLSGTTRMHVESVQKGIKEGAADGTWRDEEVPLIHRNDLYKLPDMSGVLFGAGRPTFVSMRPLRTRSTRPLVVSAPPIVATAPGRASASPCIKDLI